MSSIKECTLAFFKGLAFGKGLIKGRELAENKDMAEDRWITIHPFGWKQGEADTGEGKRYYQRIFINDETDEIEGGLGGKLNGTKITDLGKKLKELREKKSGTGTTSKQPKAAEPEKKTKEPKEKTVETPEQPEKTGEVEKVKQNEIKDFGEYLYGARKDLYRDLSTKLTKKDILDKPLSKIWPVDNIDKIEDNEVAAAVMALRMQIPKKPSAKGYFSEGKRDRWVDAVNACRETAALIVDYGAVPKDLYDKLPMAAVLKELPRAAWSDVVELRRSHGHLNKDYYKDKSQGFIDLTKDKDSEIDQWKVDPYDIYELKTNRGSFIAIADTGSGSQKAMDAISQMVQNSIPELTKAKEDQKERTYKFDIFERIGENKYFIAKRGDKNQTPLKEFDDLMSARLYNTKEHNLELAETYNAIKAMHDVDESKLRFRSSERHGGDYRQGKATDAESYDKAFGFRGVQFGNWVAQKGVLSRQNLMDQAYDALKDLANTAGVTSKDISLDGTLGLAFGARGSGGKNAGLAHYEPGTKVINLTKYGGAGCVAHEWFHALDNYVATKNGEGRAEYSSASPSVVRQNEKLYKAAKDLRNALTDTDFYKASVKADKYRSKEYWSTTHELAARGFEAYVRNKMAEKGESNKFLVNYGESDVWPSKSDIKKLAPIYDNYLKAVRETNWNKLRESEE